jgi:hypothetical protein
MAVLAADANISLLGGGVKVMGPAHQADIFYAGAILVALNVGTTGKVSCVPTSGTNERVLGLCSKKQTTTAADQLVEYYIGGVWLFPAIASVAATDIGHFLVIDKSGTVSDNFADLVSQVDITPATGDAVVGRVVGMDASSNLIVDMSWAGSFLTVTTLALQ